MRLFLNILAWDGKDLLGVRSLNAYTYISQVVTYSKEHSYDKHWI